MPVERFPGNKIPMVRTPIPQQRLRMLRDLRQKQRELRLLESQIAAEVLAEIDVGAPVEVGKLSLRVEVRQAGRSQLRRLIVE